MDEALPAQLTALGNEVKAAAIPDSCKQTVAWCFGQLPSLYAQFRQTSESRYGEAITHLVQGVLKALGGSQRACPEAQQLAVHITDRFRLLHEQYGLPALLLKPTGASPPRSRKASYANEEKQRATQGRSEKARRMRAKIRHRK